MKRTRLKMLLLLTGALFVASQYAQAVDFKFSGSIRPRVEFVDTGAQGQGVGQQKTHTTMQTRLNVKAIVDADTSAFIQLQDVRTWGGELVTGAPPSITQTGTSVRANGLDFHQAYLQLNNVLDSGLNLKIGRQEMAFDEHRLIGTIGWIQQAQAFDAVRGDVNLGALGLTAFYAQTLAKDSHPTLQLGGNNTLGGNASTFESSFSGLRATVKLGDKGDRITPYIYYALNPSRTGAGPDVVPDVAQNIKYAGLYAAKHFGSVRVRLDGAYEFGKKSATVDLQAYMITASIGTKLDIANGAGVSFWFDYLSGDDGLDPTKDKTFDTPYATNHKFYGHIDKFLNIPTGGLIDYALKLWLKPAPKFKIVVHGHVFRSPQAVVSDLGKEIDTQIHYTLAKNTKLSLGYSRFFKGDIGAVGVAGNPAVNSNWAFGMITMKF